MGIKLSDFPDLVEEWNYEKNEKKPEMYTSGSNFKVFWKCARGHEWKAMIKSRASGAKCPYCAGVKVDPAENSLAARFPELLSSWDYENNQYDPHEITAYSSKTCNWKCANGHRWHAKVYSRVRATGSGCPYCAKMYAYDSSEQLDEQLLNEWSYKNSIKLDKYKINKLSKKMVLWECSKKHEWSETVESRTIYKTQCPYCFADEHKKPYDYIVLNKKLEDELLIEVNSKSNNEQVISSYFQKLSWKCDKNHEWKSNLFDRMRGYNCPYCNNTWPVQGKTDLKTLRPDLAEEWATPNTKPEFYTLKSTKKILWKCKTCGNKWQASIYSRVKYNSQCPVCEKKIEDDYMNQIMSSLCKRDD